MSAIIFDGREFAKLREVGLRIKTYKLQGRGVTPKLVSILIGDDPASKLYVTLKKKAAERIDAVLEDYYVGERLGPDHILRLIQFFNKDPQVHGIMVQLPVPKRMKDMKERIIESIDPKKDVDGLRPDTVFFHPTAGAVVAILKEALKYKNSRLRVKSVCVVGSTGMVGAPLVDYFSKTPAGKKGRKYLLTGVDVKTKNLGKVTKKADVLISSVGIPNIITADMIKKNAIVIDVGSPKGDVDPSAALRASFITPVPGGVGPVTITCLLENLVQAAYNSS